MSIREEIRPMNRASKNGYETTFALCYLTKTHYRWELIRYPLDVNLIDIPSETILTFEGRFNWMDAINATKKYLADHPEDGFYDSY